MKIVSLSLSGYRQYLDPITIELPDGLTGICGPNGVGKSKLIEAIGYAIYGPNSHILPSGDKASDLPSKGQAGALPRVELVLELRGQQYQIVRSSRDASIRVVGAADALAEGSRGVTRKLIELLRLSPLAYRGTFVARQKEVAGLQSLSPNERQRLVNRLIGISLVEEAIKLAGVERRTREKRHSDARIALRIPSSEAKRRHDELLSASEEAATREREARSLLVAARLAREKASGRVSELKLRAEKVEGLRKEIVALRDHKITLEGQRDQAYGRLQEALSAAREIARAEETLRETEPAKADLSQHDELEQLDLLRKSRQAIVDDLDKRLRPMATARAELLKAKEEDDQALDVLRAQLSVWSGRRALAEQSTASARDEASRHEKRMATVRALGEGGRCETCGHVFGENLDQALAHYAEESREARARAASAEEEAAQARREEDAVRKRVTALLEAQAARAELLATHEGVPGEVSAAERRLREVETAISQAPSGLLEKSYDADAHALARARMAIRSEAEAAVDRLSRTAAQESSARTDEEAAKIALVKLAGKEKELEDAVAQGLVDLNAVPEAQAELDAAVHAEDAAEQLVDSASRRVLKKASGSPLIKVRAGW